CLPATTDCCRRCRPHDAGFFYASLANAERWKSLPTSSPWCCGRRRTAQTPRKQVGFCKTSQRWSRRPRRRGALITQGPPLPTLHSVGCLPVQLAGVGAGQEGEVEDVGRGRLGLEFNHERELADRLLETRRIDAAESLRLRLRCQDVLTHHHAQLLKLDVAI